MKACGNEPSTPAADMSSVRDEFRWSCFLFGTRGGENRYMFASSACVRTEVILTFRALAFCYLFVGIVLSTMQHNSYTWLYYLTSINYLLVSFHFLLAVGASLHTVFRQREHWVGSSVQLATNNNSAASMHAHASMHAQPCASFDSNTYASYRDSILMSDYNLTSQNSLYRTAPKSQLSSISSSTGGGGEEVPSSIASIGDVVVPSSPSSCQHERESDTVRILGTPETSRKKRDKRGKRDNQLFYKLEERLPLLVRLHWMVANTALLVCLVACLAWWIFLFDPVKMKSAQGLNWWIPIDRHTVVYAWLFLDFIITRTPIRLFHAIYPALFLATYCAYNFAIFKLTGRVIYPVLDYTAGTTKPLLVACVGCTVGVTCVQLINYALYRLRRACMCRRL